MPYNKPIHRNFRGFVSSPNAGYSSWAYIVDKEYSKNTHHYTRAFLIIQEDIKKLFEYIEPADNNLTVFSHQIHGLFIRICIEVEANFKAILRENIYTPSFTSGPKKGKFKNEDDWNIYDYIKINKTHHLEDYFIELPIWRGTKYRIQPFLDWKNNKPLSWYQAYNQCKHSRDEKFELANLGNLLNSFAGLFALLSSQFNCEDFQPGGQVLGIQTDNYYKGNFGIGGYLKVEFPSNWAINEMYDFDWSVLKSDKNRFQKFDYNTI